MSEKKSKILEIIKQPDPLLRQRSKEISSEVLGQPETQELIDDMIATMWQADGVGIAAPQVGKNIRVIIITQINEAMALVNPIITRFSIRRNAMDEGCLSVPGFFGSVKRSNAVRVRALERNGKMIKFKAEGLIARIIQHEIDHLDGVLFIDRAKHVKPITSAAQL